jgi:PAS domain S-box-containing protein
MKSDEGPGHPADEPSDVFRHISLGADVGAALIFGATLREALQGCAEAMVRHLDATFARIWVLNEKEGVLELQASAGLYTHINGAHARIPVAEYPYKIGIIAKEGKAHLTNEVIGDPMIHDQEWAKREGMVSFAGLPLMFRGKVVGVVAMFARKKLSETTLKAIESVADEITLGIERKRASRELKKSEERFRTLVEDSLAGAYVIVDGRVVYCNQALATTYGYSKEELGRLNVRDISLKEDLAWEEELTGKLLSGEADSLRYETRRVRKDGTVISVEMMRWSTDYEGKPAIIGTAIDVTERKKAEDALKESEAMFRSLSEEALIGIYLIQDLRFIYVNHELFRMLGYSPDELFGMDNLLETLYDSYKDLAREGINRIASGEEKSIRYQAVWVKKDGGLLDVEGTATFTAYKGRPAIIGTALDVTERKAAERERADFLAMVTHDFKAPLTSIMGFSELLMDKGSEESGDELGEMTAAIYRSGEKLSGMVEDFLVHSKLESGVAAPEKTPGKLGDVVEDVRESFSSEADKKGLELVTEIEPGLPRMNFDKKLMERAISNLIQNAVKYTPEGGKITLKAECLSGSGEDLVAISVTDTGPGIPAELQPHLFKKYFRSPQTSGVRGAGLGLTVVKSVADAHGGDVEVCCPEGEGCTFRILLPVGPRKKTRAA